MISKIIGLTVGACSSMAMDKILTNAMPEIADGMTRVMCKIGTFGISSAVAAIVAEHFEDECNEIAESIATFKNAKKRVEEESESDEQSV